PPATNSRIAKPKENQKQKVETNISEKPLNIHPVSKDEKKNTQSLKTLRRAKLTDKTKEENQYLTASYLPGADLHSMKPKNLKKNE
ncbi:11862_t:CDS:2, partial [Gigaspora margarita]